MAARCSMSCTNEARRSGQDKTERERSRGRKGETTNHVELLGKREVLDNDELVQSLLVGIFGSSPLQRIVLPLPSRSTDLERARRTRKSALEAGREDASK